MKTAPLTTYGDVYSQHGVVLTTAEGLLVQDSCQRPCLRFLPPVPPFLVLRCSSDWRASLTMRCQF
ncbi:hypothetical protein NC651_021111 [Populus alba x Populus x berolinensis]|nr:hypothetical protein NC651_021111 [Populus alba x Populus x berolinensis]